MTKELKIQIEDCKDCPYEKAIVGTSEYVCMHPKSNNNLLHDRKFFKLAHTCPLPDARKPGVRVGVSVILLNENLQILVGKRKNASSGSGCWGLPGGGMDAGEKPQETAVREIEEETSIIITDSQWMEFATFTNDCFMEESGEHWITIYYLCRPQYWKGEAKIVEPHKCEEWRWVGLHEIPQPVFCDWAKNLELLKAMIW